MDETKDAIRQAGEHSRTLSVAIFESPSEKGEAFFVPQMEVLIDGELRLFDEPEALDYPWELPSHGASPTTEQLATLGRAGIVSVGGSIDIDDERGRVTTKLEKDLQRDLSLAYVPENWTAARLAAWFCRQINDPSITQPSKNAFVASWLGKLLAMDEIDLARVNRQKFLLRNLVDLQITSLRQEAVHNVSSSSSFSVMEIEIV